MARKSRKGVATLEQPKKNYMKIWRTAIYIRLSVEFNGKRGDSLETQRQIMEAYAALCPDLEIVEVYTDNGITGRTFEREAFQRMLADVEAGKINCIMVKDLSRLGRNTIDTGYYIEKYFPLHGVRFIAVNDQFDSEDSENSGNHLIVPLKNMINEAYAADISKKVRAQQNQAMEGVKNAEVLEFIDNGYSGTNFERPAVQELLDQMREGKINCIIVKDFTRFGRNSIEVGYFMEMVFPLYGVRFISINDDFDSDKLHGDTGGINVAFKYLVSEFYSRDLSIKYKSAKYVKFRRGEYQSKTCPYGYRKGANGRMQPNEETAPNVRLIFELAQDGYKPNEIVKALFERSIPTPAEYKAAHGFTGHDISRCCGIWPTATVVHILDDERYTGTYIMGKREVTEVGGHHVRMKDESQWVKIPDHHPAIISKELFDQVQVQRPRFKCPKKNARAYPLRGKVFCGCCHHAMPRTAKKKATFFCRYTQVNESAPCHGLTVMETELERMLYEILSKQAQIILNVADLSNAGRLDVQLAEQAEYDKQIESCMDQKRVLYEQFILKQITTEEYKCQKAAVDGELDWLREIHSNLKVQTSQMEMDEKAKSARTELAQEVVGASGLTAGLANILIDRVYVYPDNRVEIIWKMKDFCMEAA